MLEKSILHIVCIYTTGRALSMGFPEFFDAQRLVRSLNVRTMNLSGGPQNPEGIQITQPSGCRVFEATLGNRQSVFQPTLKGLYQFGQIAAHEIVIQPIQGWNPGALSRGSLADSATPG